MSYITVFTPTYNREKTLNKCYTSLCAQTNKDFVWQIIDDGSTDNTKQTVDSFVREGKISIDYHYKSNGGKTTAINYSLNITTTPFWVCLDSDDYFFSDAIEKIVNACNSLEKTDDICGIFCVRSDKNGAPMKAIDVPQAVTYATQYEIRYIYKVPPEYCQVYKTSIAKMHPFPVHEDERFMVLSWMQDQIDCHYKFKIIHTPLMVCEYLSDGITKNYYKLMCKNPKGFTDYYEQRMKLPLYKCQKFKSAIMYNAVYGLIKIKDRKHINNFLTVAMLIPGIICRQLIRNRGRKK